MEGEMARWRERMREKHTVYRKEREEKERR